MPLTDLKSEKESKRWDKKERQAKKTKSYEIGAIGEGCESKKSKMLGMRACHARGRETPHKKISKRRRFYKAARLVYIFYTCKLAFFKFVNTDIYRLRNLQKKQYPSLTFRRRRVSKNLNQYEKLIFHHSPHLCPQHLAHHGKLHHYSRDSPPNHAAWHPAPQPTRYCATMAHSAR